MIQINCPYCGVRDEREFAYGGEPIERPADPSQETDTDWSQFLHARTNSAGTVREQWWHQHGCRMWFWVERNRSTHEILSTSQFGDAS